MSKTREKTVKKPGQEFLFQVRYKNDLPQVPFDPKLLKYPHPEDRLYKCFESSLMKKHRYDLVHPEGDQGLSCNPFALGFLERATKNPNEKLVPRKDLLDPKDLQLLVGPVEKLAKTKEAPVVPWLRRTEYISSERASFGRNRADASPGMSLKDEKSLQDLSNMTIEQQIEKIEKSFESARKARLNALSHPKHKELEALEIFPIFPDFETWVNPYFLATYDEDPLGEKYFDDSKEQMAALEETILKPLQHAENPSESWLAYYAPTANAFEKIRLKRKLEEMGREVPEEEYEHDFVRDFDPLLGGEDQKLKYSYFMEMRKDEGGAFYHPIQNQMKLKKRRMLSKDDEFYEEDNQKPTRVVLKHRPFSEEENKERKELMQELLQRETELE